MATTVSLKPNAVEISGSTSGTTTLQATAVAGTTTLTLPAATDTLVGKATTDTLTNKTLTGAVMNGTLGATTPSTVAATTISASSTATFAAGAVGTPSITTSGDTNTGIFFPAADTIAFAEGGVESMRIDSSGNLGIGTSSPGVKLETSTARSATVTSAIFGQTGTGAVNDVNKITLKLQNTLGGSTGGSGIGAILEASASNKTGLGFYYDSGSGSQTEAARIDSSGNLLVGTTDNSNLASAQGLYLRGTGADNCLYGLNNATTTSGVSLALFYSSFSTANQTKFEVKSNGDVSSRTNSYGGFSDVRLKQGITPASSQWSDIKNIEVVKFQMKSEQFSDAENPWMLGVIAQQVEQVSPRLVDEDVKDGMKTVKYSILYMKAVKALQEAMARIEQLETRITALEGA